MAFLKLTPFAAIGSGFALVGGSPCHAQSPTPGNNLEIVVTAQRRLERPQDVPISLTVLAGDQLDRMQSTDAASLGAYAPGLVMTRSGAFTQPYLRGVGKRSTLGVENSVATYVDGVYLASSISALRDLRGVERVEVLNGPQGTLFGRNSTGGVIQIITKDPTPGTSGELELHAGSYEYLRGDAYLTGGTDRLAGNLDLSISRNGGYGTNHFTGNADVGAVDHSIVGRSKWVWRPAESLKLTLSGDYQDLDQDFTQLPLQGFPAIGKPPAEGFWDADQDASSRYRFHYGGVSLRADGSVSGMTIMSLTAQRWTYLDYGADLDQGPQPLLSASPRALQRQFSQELQLQSPAASRLTWIAGFYYIHIDEQYDRLSFQYGGVYSAMLGGRTVQSLSSAGDVSSYAPYGQATLAIDQRTRLTAGLRYTIEDRSVQASGEQLYAVAPFVRPIAGLPLPTQSPLDKENSFSELTWRASLDRRFSNALIGYISVSRGFQSGGWNLQTPQSPAFGPEFLDAFETGFKFADARGRFSADASAFLYNYADMQVSAYTPLGLMTTNATSATLYGLDLQTRARLGESTDVTLGAQALRANFNRFQNATCTNFNPNALTPFVPVICDATGHRLPFAPDLKLNLAANHAVFLGSHGILVLSGAAAYNSGYYSDPDNVVRQKAFATFDASIEWRPAGHGPSLRLWALNLTDTRYYDGLSTFPTAGVLYKPAAPRRVGGSVAYAF